MRLVEAVTPDSSPRHTRLRTQLAPGVPGAPRVPEASVGRPPGAGRTVDARGTVMRGAGDGASW